MMRSSRCSLIAGLTVAVLAVTASAATPAVGTTLVYRVINGYNNEPRGEARYRIEGAATGRVTVAITTDVPALTGGRTGVPDGEVLDAQGNAYKRTLVNHDHPAPYEFAVPFPAFVHPLDVGRSWSQRVTGTNGLTGRRHSVRVDGAVLAAERVQVPAGTFDTLKIRRRIYAGDWEGFRFETNIIETEWYAPALGYSVRRESTSNYMNPSQCGEHLACPPVQGDWHVLELIEPRAPGR